MAGLKLRKARESRRPSVSQYKLAASLGVTRSRIASYEGQVAEPPGPIIAEVSRMWGIPEEWFWDEQDSPVPATANRPSSGPKGEQTPLTGRQTDTNIEGVLSMLAPRNRVPAFLGASARPFTMSSDHVEEVEIPFALGDQYLVVVVNDGTLKPEIRPGTVLVFRRTTTPVEDSPVIVESAEEEGVYAIRRFDPEGDEGRGTFSDRRGVLEPLSRDGWRMRGVLAAMAADGGLVV